MWKPETKPFEEWYQHQKERISIFLFEGIVETKEYKETKIPKLIKEIQKNKKENELWETNAKYLEKNKKEYKKKEKIENRLLPEILDKKKK